jgi:signal transduction histidine kinase
VAGRPIDLTRLLNALPDYLARLVETLSGEPSLRTGGTAAWVDVAREHAVTRVHLGFDIRQLVQEFAILRRVIVGVLRETDVAPLDVEQMEEITELIESAIAEVVDSYVRARDFDARRVEAEHIGFVAHELRSPLMTAQLVAGQLCSDAKHDEDKRGELLQRSLRRATALIEGILQTERLEARVIEPSRERLLLREVIEPPVESARVRAQAKNFELRAEYDSNTFIFADRKLTISAVQNLIDNAVKFTNHGAVELRVEERCEDVVIHVIDRGPGISTEELAIIFEPFRRGSTHGGVPGAGLGLAITKRALEAQGSSIQCESRPGEGAHFWFALPKTQR